MATYIYTVSVLSPAIQATQTIPFSVIYVTWVIVYLSKGMLSSLLPAEQKFMSKLNQH